jgi:hypothetical protein
MNIQQIKYDLVFFIFLKKICIFVFLKTTQQRSAPNASSASTFITDHYNPLTGTITTTTASGSFASNDLFSSSNNKRKMNESDDEDDNYDM